MYLELTTGPEIEPQTPAAPSATTGWLERLVNRLTGRTDEPRPEYPARPGGIQLDDGR